MTSLQQIHEPTKYLGIYLQGQPAYVPGDGQVILWWIADDDGCDKFFHYKKPTEQDVEEYRRHCIVSKWRSYAESVLADAKAGVA